MNDSGIGAHTIAMPSATKNRSLRLGDSGVTSSSGVLSGAVRLKNSTSNTTYEDISGNLTTARLREALTYVENEGAMRGELIIVCAPAVRDDIFELLGGQQQLFEKPAFGFEGAIRFDGVPVLPDSDCPSDSLFVVDRESCYVVIGKAPQMTGLAKVGAAEEAYVETHLAHVYEQPRRIVWLDGLTRVTS